MFNRTTSRKIFAPRPPRSQRIFFYLSELGALCAFARGLVFPILPLFSELGALCAFARGPSLSDSSPLLRTWRPLRLCERPSFPDSVIQNSTENFKYVWLGFSFGSGLALQGEGTSNGKTNSAKRKGQKPVSPFYPVPQNAPCVSAWMNPVRSKPQHRPQSYGVTLWNIIDGQSIPTLP